MEHEAAMPWIGVLAIVGVGFGVGVDALAGLFCGKVGKKRRVTGGGNKAAHQAAEGVTFLAFARDRVVRLADLHANIKFFQRQSGVTSL